MPDPSAAPLLVDRVEAARLLCCCPRTVDALAKRGELPRVMIGRLVRFDVADLRGWIEKVKAGAAGVAA